MTLDKMRRLLQAEYGRHSELLESNAIQKYEKDYFLKILENKATEVDLTFSLENLSRMLTEHYSSSAYYYY